MDPTQIKKIQAMNRYKRRQFLDNLYFYFLTTLICSMFCCVTLSLPYLSSFLRVFFLAHISSLIPLLLSSKLIFIIGNLIIFFLVVNSRILSSDSSSTSVVYYDEYIHSCQTKMPQIQTTKLNKPKTLEKLHVLESVDMIGEDGPNTLDLKGNTQEWEGKEEENLDGGDEQSLLVSSDELNKRADDFIARVNRQRRLELSLLHYGSN
ncbi:hypothetical protein VNO77_00604 [Canavalia gladiata]|uniref:Transmembrane protein n=1 Tax=Canavalia gladiata TaxID=3824 RepID=A0AAN9MQC4_CANGL